ncbi:MAG: GNAT family N-acetyltransferase [Fimbriimonas sp.]|nr:GNAT family N-acetyltransferase [Fimbriimonas sp.]
MPIKLHLLQLEQLKSLRAGSSQVDGYFVTPGTFSERDTVDFAIDKVKQGLSPVWHSLYLFVEEHERRAVGSGGFHDSPCNGRVELGYEVAESYRSKGVATDAVRLLVKAAFECPTVVEVFAQSAIGNAASRRVLEKVGFRHIGRDDVRIHGLCDRWLLRRSVGAVVPPESP